MTPTSHFIGVKLKSELLVNLYVRLQKALGVHVSILEFQNILSAHITLYYLPAEISEIEMTTIFEVVQKFQKVSIKLNDFRYFGDREAPKLCYLSPVSSTDILEDYNTLLRQHFPRHADNAENALKYIPHMTLFMVRDVQKFLEFQPHLEEILKNELTSFGSLDFFESFEVFAVNSGFHPEIQMVV